MQKKEEIKKGGFHTRASVHDPSIFADQDGSYYIFGTHMTAAVSEDLRYWDSFAENVNAENPLFCNLFEGEKRAFSFAGSLEEGSMRCGRRMYLTIRLWENM